MDLMESSQTAEDKSLENSWTGGVDSSLENSRANVPSPVVHKFPSLELSMIKVHNFQLNNSIEVLNDDCLLDVLRKVPIQDRMRFLIVSRRWRRLIEESFHRVTPLQLQRFIEDTCYHTNIAIQEIVRIVRVCIRRIRRVVVNVHYGKHLQNSRVLDVLRSLTL